MNDCEPLLCFAQQVNGYGKAGDVFLGISTSGNSKNVLYAATTAHAKGMKVIGLTGAKSGKLEQMSDICIKVPQTETYMIQELHRITRSSRPAAKIWAFSTRAFGSITTR